MHGGSEASTRCVTLPRDPGKAGLFLCSFLCALTDRVTQEQARRMMLSGAHVGGISLLPTVIEDGIYEVVKHSKCLWIKC